VAVMIYVKVIVIKLSQVAGMSFEWQECYPAAEGQALQPPKICGICNPYFSDQLAHYYINF
jgi:hypothetical protein